MEFSKRAWYTQLNKMSCGHGETHFDEDGENFLRFGSARRLYDFWSHLNKGVLSLNAEGVIEEAARLCRSFGAKEVILYGSRAKGTARERSDIDIAVSGVNQFDVLAEKIEELPTLYSVDLLNLDTCRNELLLEDIRQYGREI